MDKWAQRIIAASALIFALSVAGWVVRPRAQTTAFQLEKTGSHLVLFDSKTGTLYTTDSDLAKEMQRWAAFRTLPAKAGSAGR